MPLTGATGHAALAEDVPATAANWGVDVGTATRLLGRYGSPQVLAPATARPELRELVPGTGGYLAAELLYAVTHEGARRLEDILERRTRVAVETVDGGLGDAEPTARLVAPVLGWDSHRVHAEVARYRKHLRAERQAQRAERTHEVAAPAR